MRTSSFQDHPKAGYVSSAVPAKLEEDVPGMIGHS